MASTEDFKLLLIDQMQSGANILLNFLLQDRKFKNHKDQIIQHKCREDLVRVCSSALKNERWALTVFDSNGRPNSGLSGGSLFNFIGNYEQCLKVDLLTESQLSGTKYCLGQLDLSSEAKSLASLTDLPESLFNSTTGRTAQFGVCIPSSCNSSDIFSLIKHMSSITQAPSRSAIIQQIKCYDDNQQYSVGVGFLIFIISTLLIVGIRVWATIIDETSTKKGKIGSSDWFINTFSLSRALKRLKTRRLRLQNSINLTALDGLRVISMFWTITMHSYNFSFQWILYDNMKQVDNVYKSPWIQWISNGTFSMDNFCLISGLLFWFKHNNYLATQTNSTGKKPLEDNQKIKKPNLVSIGLRYLRLAPNMMFLILFSVTVLPLIAYGPNWSNSTQMFDSWCQTNWFLDLFMIQNLVNTQNMCFSHSWYVAVNFQLFLLLQLILYLRNKFPFRIASQINKLILICSILIAQIVVATIVYFRRLPSIPLIPADSLGSIDEYYGLIYIKPYYWLSSYFIGALLADSLRSSQQTRPKLLRQMMRRESFCIVVQMVPLMMIILLILSSWFYFSDTIQMSLVQSTVFSLISRPLWSLSLATLLYFVAIPHPIRLPKSRRLLISKLIASILNSDIWIVPSKLSYSAFLLHPVIMAIFYGSRTETFQFSHSLLLYFNIGNIVLSYLGALLIYLFIENPINVLIQQFQKQTVLRVRNKNEHS